VTAYQGWVLAALLAFSLGPVGISLWLSSSFLAVRPRKRARLLAGVLTLGALLLSGWLPGRNLYRRMGDAPFSPVIASEVVVLAYLHVGAVVGMGILFLGRRRAPRPIPPTRDEDLGLGKALLALHRNQRGPSVLARLPFNQVYQVRLRDWVVPLDLGSRPLPAELNREEFVRLGQELMDSVERDLAGA